MNFDSVAVMQPYFFPYIGYFFLIKSADLFVCFDDVNFIKKGWINRNRIMLNGAVHQIGLPIRKMSQNKKINESFIFEPQKEKKAVLDLITTAYCKRAPFFDENIDKIKELILLEEDNVAIYNTKNLQSMAEYLEIKTKFVRSSQVPHNLSLAGAEKILSLVKYFEGKTYINASGGVELYDKTFFSTEDVELKFIPSCSVNYVQGRSPFVSNLSIIDVLMYAGRKKVVEFLDVPCFSSATAE